MAKHQFDLVGRFGNGCATHPIVEALEESSNGEEFVTRVASLLSSLSTEKEAYIFSKNAGISSDLIEEKFGADISSEINTDVLKILRAFQND